MPSLKFLLLCLLSDGGLLAEDISGVRLVGTDNPCAGRLEVMWKGTWGTVCDKQLDAHDSAVVCKQLGCGSALESPGLSFGPGSGPVWLEAVFCDGTEQNLSQCRSRRMRQVSYDHAQDVGVMCSGSGISAVRLLGDQGPCAGRVEVFLQGRWSTVCSLGWSSTSSSIICNTLGCGRPLATTTVLDHLVVLHGLLCGPADHNISQCSLWMSNKKLHADEKAVVVACSGTEDLAVSPPHHHVVYFWSSWIFRLLIAMALFVSIHLGLQLLLVFQKQN